MGRFLCCLLTLAACVGTKSPDTGVAADDSSPPSCPVTLEEFCSHEFGGACPTFEAAAALGCDGAHFSTSGTETPTVDTDGYETCPNPTVSCSVSEDHGAYRTKLWFNADMSGRLEGVTVNLPDTDVCPGSQNFGDLWC